MNRTRRWEFVKQDALRLAGLGLSAEEIAQRLDVGRATVFRWKKEGKLTVGGRTPVPQLGIVTGQTPSQWASSVREAYALDVTDEQIVTMAESCLLVARDPATPAALRLSAMREFRGAVKQLALVARSSVENGEPEQPKRQKFEAPKRSGVDPRALLQAVK